MAKKNEVMPENDEAPKLEMSEEDFRYLEELDKKITGLEAKLERLRTALAGGTIDGDKYVGYGEQISTINGKLEDLEALAVRLDVSGPPIPESFYASLTPDQLFLSILQVTMRCYFEQYPRILTENGKPASQQSHLREVVATSKFLFETAVGLFPKVTVEKTKN